MASTVFELSLTIIIFTLMVAIATFPTCADQKPCDAETTSLPGNEKLIAKTTVTSSPYHKSKRAAYGTYVIEIRNGTAIKTLVEETETVTSESTSTATRFTDEDTAEIDVGAVVTLEAHYLPEDVTQVSRLLPESPAETSTPAAADSQPTTEAQSQSHTGHGQTPATAAPPTPPRQSPLPEGDAVPHFRKISAEEKAQRLIKAAKEGSVRDVEALLTAGADVGARDMGRSTALHWAAGGGHEEVVKRLLGAGAEVNARNSLQAAPLHWAAEHGHTAVVQLLLAGSADPVARQQDSWTPLHYAARHGHAAVVRLLLASSADIEARQKYSWTPLHMAAYWGHAEIAAQLLKAGADREARINTGKTPLDLARQEKHQQLIDMLT